MKDTAGEVIQYIEGSAWGIAPNGRSVYLGTESDIQELLVNKKLKVKDKTIMGIISLERTLSGQVSVKERKQQEKETAARKARHKLAIKMGVAKVNKRRPQKTTKRG